MMEEDTKIRTMGNFFPTEIIINAKSDKFSAEDLPLPETAVSASPKGEFSFTL